MSALGNGSVRLLIPARAALLRFARVTAATLAVELSFTIEDIEDLRVAVDELAAAAIEGCEESATLELSFAGDDADLVIEGRVESDGAGPALHPVARELLELLADEYDFRAEDGVRAFRLVKRRSAGA
jgi:anti-sigma regulatory factor (Ser/Thr protein kinase)